MNQLHIKTAFFCHDPCLIISVLMSVLEQIKQWTTIVADTGDVECELIIKLTDEV